MAWRPLPAWLYMFLIAMAACAPPSGAPERQVLVEGLADERDRLQIEREANPGSVDARIALGEAYYRTAREFLDLEHNEEGYLIFLSKSVDEFVSAVELDPSDARPHFYLGMMDVYRGDIEKALGSFRNALTLRPSGSARTNLAEIFVYMDQLEKARQWNQMGQQSGASNAAVLFNKMLIAWRNGDLPESEQLFGQLRDLYPDAINTINVARLPFPPRRFEEFARYCCGSPACGPYMREPCASLGITVLDRELSAAAALKELRIEIEETRRLREVYRQRKELEVEIEGAPPTGP